MNGLIKNTETSDKYTQYVSFRVNKEIYGIPVIRSQEVLYLTEMSHIPNTASFLKGVIDLRGTLVPLIDLRILFQLDPRNYDEDTVVIITKINGTVLGLIADAVLDVVILDEKEIQQMSSTLSKHQEKGYIAGISKTAGSIIMLLDVDKLLFQKEFRNVVKTASS